MIASHYAARVERKLAVPTRLLSGPGDDFPELAELKAGDSFELLDDTLGWAWGYAGRDRVVGYVSSGVLA